MEKSGSKSRKEGGGGAAANATVKTEAEMEAKDCQLCSV